MRRRRILIARHGQTEWNALGKLQGISDIPLNELGREQATALAAKLAGEAIATIWTSDLSRARQTAEIVATSRGLAAPVIERDLRERGVGVFEGLTRDDCATHHPEAWQRWQAATHAPPGGEERPDAVERMRRVLTKIAAATSTDAPVLAVTHGGLMRLWLLDVLGPGVPMIPNAAVYAVDLDLDAPDLAPTVALRAEP
jgi:broad specificity phosphatase PhoE